MRLAPRVPYDGIMHIKCKVGWIKVQCEDLSLFGVKFRYLNGSTCEHHEWVKLKLNIDNRTTVFNGRIYREENRHAVALFNEDDLTISELLGRFFTDRIRRSGRCPYCKERCPCEGASCPSCGMPIDFTQADLVQTIRRLKVGDVIAGRLPEEVKSKVCEENTDFVGSCERMTRVFDLIRRFAPTDYPVLILGETGTGKELTARAIHEKSPRREKAFIAINCGAIPGELLEAELFGYEKGAFTGAHRRKPGKIEQANGGTLFLDEIGELPLELQVKLLRFLEDYTFSRVGGNETIKADVRLIAATNGDLRELVRKGKFREDLYYRLKVLSIELPPLRDRGEDKVLMAKYFLEKFKREQEKSIEGFTDEAIELIENYSWPGNVRELINVMKKAVVMTDKRFIDAVDLDVDTSKVSKNIGGQRLFNLKEHMDKLEKELVEKAFNVSKGNISKMASMLGVSRPTVYKLIEKHNLA
ncbi:sigma-54 dependent transcriptional regulator [Hydrogenivirga sp. 128-5-R1-1]|uniref:sigma-54 interaction domain-containing protein n=1 Tax=Hydrogenivirga sp. 128-5-R1-1 TaxID=392423 RepID=UPI0012F89560|nr:sigma-54 dependent transcriptional regulator [Hydrogenivirga sp. 128-5-R1-1]